MSRFLILSFVAFTACAGAEADPKTGASPSTATPPPTMVQACEQFLAKARTCTDDFIPALVDLRIELDKPAGIAAAAQTEGRDALIAQAMTEWAQDSQPAAITANCEKVAQSIPPAQVEGMRAESEACFAVTDCAEFATCAIALQRQHMP